MNVDQLARAASAQLVAAVEKEVDPMTMMQELTHRRNRRRAAEAAVAVVAVAACAALVALGPWRDQPTPQPARTPTTTTPSRPPGTVLVHARLDANVLTFTGPQAGLEHSPQSIRDVAGFAALGFTADGNQLVYGTVGGVRAGGGRADGEVHSFDVRTGADTVLGDCNFPCPVAWAPDARRVVTLAGGGLAVLGPAPGAVAPIPVPPGWEPTSVDVSGAGRVVAAGRVSGQAAVMAVGLDGSAPSVVLRAGRVAEVSEARWGPDGGSIAFVHRDRPGDDVSGVGTLSVRTVGATGGAARSLAQVGSCQCVGISATLDWAPDGRLAVASAVLEGQHLFLVTDSGDLTPMDDDAIGPIAWRPAE